MVEVEGRYMGFTSSEDEDDDGDSEEGSDEWYQWTTNIDRLAEKMRRDVDQITDMPYTSFLFWSNYYRLRAEEEYRNRKNG